MSQSHTTPTLQVGWVIVYVDDPPAASAFYADTFGLKPEFAAPDGSYAQLDTGPTRLAFASYGLGEACFPGGVRRADRDQPCHVEIALSAEDVDGAYAAALAAGCIGLAEPMDKPHGQRCSWVRDPFGTLLEIASPMD
jgi:predicted enzyme related to lactoylglutathione lyase